MPPSPETTETGARSTASASCSSSCLHTRFVRVVEGAFFARLRPGEPIEQLLVNLVGALAERLDTPPDDFASTTDLDALVEAAVDLAEDARAWVVLDDLHHAPADAADFALDAIARYARRSRFVVTSRVAPAAKDLFSQVLRLGALSDDALAQIAQGVGPTAERSRIRVAVQSAAGSPWRLLQQMSHGGDATADDLLGPLDARASALLSLLARVEIALPIDVVERCLGGAPAELVEPLVRRGLVER